MRIAFLVLGGALLVQAQAGTFAVTATRDEPDATPGDGVCASQRGTCTLRAAVMEANATAEPSTITLPAGRYSLTRRGIDEDSLTGDLDVRGSLTIVGSGARTTIIDGQRARDRLVDVQVGATLDLSGLTLRRGRVRGRRVGGGCLRAFGTLALHDAVVTRCRSTDDAGGVDVQQGVVTLTDVVLRNNRTGDDGGAIDVDAGTATLQRVLVANNIAADEGGGIENSGGNVTLLEVTITGNRARTDAGGLSIEDGALTLLDHCTITKNRAAKGAGLFSDDTEHGANTTVVRNTTLRGNKRDDCTGPFVDDGLNVGGTSCAFTR